jgi:hypothetical protein
MQERGRSARAGGLWTRGAFWDEVEAEIESLDPRELAEFVAADRLPFEARPAFREGLAGALRGLVRLRYCH